MIRHTRAWLAVAFAAVVPSAVARAPHVVYFLVDDMGWANVGFHNDEPLTPTIDALARGGAQLERFYTYKVCSPTRSSFLSGRLPIHVNQVNHPPATPGGGVPPEMSTIADVLNKAEPSYVSHQIGKWHGGMSRTEQLPINRGFASSFGYLSGAEDHFEQTRDVGNNAHFHDFWRDDGPATGETGEPIAQCGNMTYLTRTCRYSTYQYAAEAVKIVRAHPASSPLFLYLAFGAMHGPIQSPQKFLDMFDSGTYHPRREALAMMAIVDEAVQNVTAAIRARPGMWNDTLVVFSSECVRVNGGPVDHANNYPLRGHKATDLEGGVRVAAFLAGGFLPAAQRGRTVGGMLHITDLYATLAGLAGVDPIDTNCAASGTSGGALPCPPIDSLDMWPMLSGANSTSPRAELPLSGPPYSPSPGFIGEGGRYKLLRGTVGDLLPGPHMPNRSDAKRTLNCTPACLFDLENDPTEHTDLAADPAHAALLARLQARAAHYDGTVFQSEGGDIAAADPAAKRQAVANGGFWGPWQADTPFPTPVPPPPPAPPTPPTPAPPAFTLRWAPPQGGESCLVLSKLAKGGHAGLGPCEPARLCTWGVSPAGAYGTGGLYSLNVTDARKRFLRQASGTGNCSLGNSAMIGIAGASGGVVSAFDAAAGTVAMTSCDGLCLGVNNSGIDAASKGGAAARAAQAQALVLSCSLKA
eukprot:g5845.t1